MAVNDHDNGIVVDDANDNDESDIDDKDDVDKYGEDKTEGDDCGRDKRALWTTSLSSWRWLVWDPPTHVLALLSALALVLAGCATRYGHHPPTDTSFRDDMTAVVGDDKGDELRTRPRPATPPLLPQLLGLPSRRGDPFSSSSPYEYLTCPVASFSSLLPLERRPHSQSRRTSAPTSAGGARGGAAATGASRRHAVPPPVDAGGSVALVCCRTTAGPLSVAVHENWAPHGSRRFLDMVRDGYYDAGAPFFRCSGGAGGVNGAGAADRWCEFSAGGRMGRKYRDMEIPDDYDWTLPLLSSGLGEDGLNGDSNRRRRERLQRQKQKRRGEKHLPLVGTTLATTTTTTTRRIPRGTLTYAPPPPNLSTSATTNRTHRMALTLTDIDHVRASYTTPAAAAASAGGGNGNDGWEVPFAELVHASSYETLRRIYDGYGENGPTDKDVLSTGNGLGGRSVDLMETFPRLDYVLGCHIVDEEVVTMDE